MNTTRLHVDGHGVGWAIVRCELCADINKYPALDALNAPVKCIACGTVLRLRDALMAEVAKSPHVPAYLSGPLPVVEAPRAALGDD